jgi:sialidase-1
LAYCEARNPTASDWGNIDLLLRRSVDCGKTWLPPPNVPKVAGPHRTNPAAPGRKLTDERWVTYNNPVAVADRSGDGAHFLFCLESMRAFYTRSGDGGATFEPPIEITDCFEGFRANYDWKVIATGPGHGIPTRRGRLVVPVWLSPATGGNAHRPSVTATIFSDESGRSWRAGEIAVPDTSETSLPNEASIAEPRGGRVLLNVRSESQDGHRILVESPDGAIRWSRPRFNADLVDPVCFGSMLRLGGGKTLVFAVPAERARRNLTLRISRDGGRSWRVSRSISTGRAGYSDLAEGGDGQSILRFYERGALTEGRFRAARLTFVRIPLRKEGARRHLRARPCGVKTRA